jgi:serine/threonine-protein kinase
MLGDRLGKWVIFKELGRGGMGRVFLAQEELNGRQAAIKILAAELAQDTGFLQRFEREIQTLSQLDHPNIVRFYEAGFENNQYFYAMEYVDGQSLEEALTAQGRLRWQEVLDAAIQVCHALRHVHDHGVIHRDLKPPNLLRTATGQIKLTDFGIAKVFASSHLTATGGVVGTADFLSPEQAAGKPVTKRSDLYSLGVVLYTLLTGKPPFEGGSFVELLHKHRYGQFDRPQRRVPEIPYELDEIICQLLEKDPSKRPPDCLVLGRQLEAIRRKLERKSQPTQDNAPQAQTVADNRPEDFEPESLPGPSTLMSRLVRAELERQKRQGPIGRLLNRAWLLALLLVLCVATIVWAFWPASAAALFEHGAQLMASRDPADWDTAWKDYLEPLEKRYPDHPYQAEVSKFREQRERARRNSETPGEAERLFRHGERLLKEGQYQQAKKVWQNLTQAFAGVHSEKKWVGRSEEGLKEVEKSASSKERWEAVREALKRAASLRSEGNRAEAEKIWSSIQFLYADDPWASEILAEVAKARAQK